MKRYCGWVNWRDYNPLTTPQIWDRIKQWRPGTCLGIFQSADVDESRPICVIETLEGQLVEVPVNNVVFLPDAGASPAGLTPPAASVLPLTGAAPSFIHDPEPCTVEDLTDPYVEAIRERYRTDRPRASVEDLHRDAVALRAKLDAAIKPYAGGMIEVLKDILGGAPLSMPERPTMTIPITQRAVDRWFDGLRSAFTRRGRRQRRIEAARRARYTRESTHD